MQLNLKHVSVYNMRECYSRGYRQEPYKLSVVSVGGFTAVTNIQLVFLRSLFQLLVTANVVPSLLILFALMMETAHSSETSILTRATRRHIPADGILVAFSYLCTGCLVPYRQQERPEQACNSA
jgi:hypothetical protein